MKLSTLIVFLAVEPALGFTPTFHNEPRSSTVSSLQAKKHDEGTSDGGRRGAISTLLAAAALLPAGAAMAEDKLFRPNPLTNGVLEQMRIWNQEEADTIQYGGELAPGDAGNKGKVEAYPRLLVPIVQIANDLTTVNTLVRVPDASDRTAAWTKAQTILAQPQYQKLAFKKTFNAYGDNIYYSDPDRANAYLGGGAAPKSEQSMAYLLRNDVLTNLENLQAELDYLLKPSTPDTEGPDDLYLYAKTAKTAMDKYLTLAPPNELKAATEMLASTASSD